MKIKSILFGALLGITLVVQGQHRMINTQAQLEDLKELQLNFEKYHPGLYRYTSKDSIDLVFRQVETKIKEQPIVNFYADITWLLNKVKCGHTRGALPEPANDAFKATALFLPISVKYLGEQLYVNEAYNSVGKLKKGEEIISINEKPIAQINALIFSHLSSDGFINSGNYRQTERNFNFYYQLYVEGNVGIYRMEIKGVNGIVRKEVILGEQGKTLSKLQRISERRPALSLKINADHAILDIRTFDSKSINNGGQDYHAFLEKSFTELKKQGVQNLILDLRGNGGGDDNYGATLVSYFAKEPFRYFDRIEVTDFYSVYGTVSKREGSNLMSSHQGLEVWQPQKNRFEGHVYVLIDGLSFSTCADVATVLHHHQLAIFIGEETGGGYDGNTSGNSKSLTLTNSGIRVNVPMWKYTTANVGHPYHGRGVKPDFPLYQSVLEFIDHKDVVLEKALQLIQEN